MTRLRKITLLLLALIVILGSLSLLKLKSTMETRAQNATETALIPTETPQLEPPLTGTAFTAVSETDVPIIPTLTSQPPSCRAIVIGGDRFALQLPGSGMRTGEINLPNGAEVLIKGRIPDHGWFPISYAGLDGWVRSDFIDFDSSCVMTLPVSKLLFFIQNTPLGYKIMYEDTFYDDQGSWVDFENRKITSRTSNEYGDYFLTISSESRDLRGAKLVNANLQRVGDFELQMSLSPLVNSSTTSTGYFGIRFHVSEDRGDYYELRILRKCDIQLFRVQRDTGYSPIYNTRLRFPLEMSNCSDGIDDYLRLSVRNNLVTGQINDLRLPEIQLSDPNGLLSIGGIELVASEFNTRVYYLVITAPN
jgi:hypothetical protein